MSSVLVQSLAGLMDTAAGWRLPWDGHRHWFDFQFLRPKVARRFTSKYRLRRAWQFRKLRSLPEDRMWPHLRSRIQLSVSNIPSVAYPSIELVAAFPM